MFLNLYFRNFIFQKSSLSQATAPDCLYWNRVSYSIAFPNRVWERAKVRALDRLIETEFQIQLRSQTEFVNEQNHLFKIKIYINY